MRWGLHKLSHYFIFGKYISCQFFWKTLFHPSWHTLSHLLQEVFPELSRQNSVDLSECLLHSYTRVTFSKYIFGSTTPSALLRRQLVGLLGLHNHRSQFLIINLFVRTHTHTHTHTHTEVLFLWKTLTYAGFGVPLRVVLKGKNFKDEFSELILGFLELVD